MFNDNKKVGMDYSYFRLGRIYQTMKSDIIEDDDNYTILIDVPGYEKDDLKIVLDGEYLEVIGTRIDPLENGKYLHKEKYYGTTTRKYFIGDIKKDKINANLLNGILKLTIPKDDSFDETTYVEIK